MEDQLSANDNQTKSIAVEARECLRIFEAICEALRTVEPEEASRIGFERNTILLDFQDAQARFKAWGVSIAAFRDHLHPMSLDFRLRDAPSIQMRLCRILGELQEYLGDC
jgi:hypothetical protein